MVGQMTRPNKQALEDQKRKPSVSPEVPSAEELPVPGKCLFCHRPSDDVLGAVTKNVHGWWLHFGCRVQLAAQTNPWR
jgi:hypothetical protein